MTMLPKSFWKESLIYLLIHKYLFIFTCLDIFYVFLKSFNIKCVVVFNSV